MMLLAAPAATAGSICLDLARGTLAHVLVTDLTSTEIILGKLAARIVPVLGLLVCILPIMAMQALLGGIDVPMIAGAMFVTIGVVVVGCSAALAFSTMGTKTHEVLLSTYAAWALWLLASNVVGSPVGFPRGDRPARLVPESQSNLAGRRFLSLAQRGPPRGRPRLSRHQPDCLRLIHRVCRDPAPPRCGR